MSLLYLGLDPSDYDTDQTIIHYPLVKATHKSYSAYDCCHVFSQIQKYTHVILTNLIEIQLFMECSTSHGYTNQDLSGIQFVALGSEVFRTAKSLNLPVIRITKDPGYIHLLHWLALRSVEKMYLCISKSGFSIPPIRHVILQKSIRHQIYHLYDLSMHIPKVLIDLQDIEQIVFTNPITVKVFFSLYNRIPIEKTLISLDSSTKEILDRYL